jgi:hypothetical protein
MSEPAVTGQSAALDRIKTIRLSMACFRNGAIGFLPIIGVMQAVLALIQAGQLRVRQRENWNPAAHYRLWGAGLAIIGLISTAVIAIEILSLF